jgi:hypothetical protein
MLLPDPNLPLPFLSHRPLADAEQLLAEHGEAAALAAAGEAARARDRGNHLRFCHWREVERVILLLADDAVVGSVH